MTDIAKVLFLEGKLGTRFVFHQPFVNLPNFLKLYTQNCRKEIKLDIITVQQLVVSHHDFFAMQMFYDAHENGMHSWVNGNGYSITAVTVMI